MKIMFISNFPVERVCRKEGLKCNYKEGWVWGYLSLLSTENEVLYCFPYKKNKRVSGTLGENISYQSYCRKTNNWKYTKRLQREIDELLQFHTDVDIVHIMGTEYGSTLAFMKAAKLFGILHKCIVSLQGVIWTYAYHYGGGLSDTNCRRWALGDLYFGYNISRGKRNFERRGGWEKEVFSICQNAIGRTEYDYAAINLINNAVRYYQCGEILRDSFYENEWNYEGCCKGRIFVSQGNYPLKGLHFLILALSLVIQKKPEVEVYVTGRDVLNCKILTSYQKYLKKLIIRLGCQNNIHFLGKLNEERMLEQYLMANIYVNPSVIENSSNSIGEAMILGVPVIASDVGGTKDIIKDKEEGILYQYDAYYMLAYYIDRLLGDKEMALLLSAKARARGLSNHNKAKCYETLLHIYKEISGDKG